MKKMLVAIFAAACAFALPAAEAPVKNPALCDANCGSQCETKCGSECETKCKKEVTWRDTLDKVKNLSADTGISGFMAKKAPAYITGDFDDADKPNLKKGERANRNGYYDKYDNNTNTNEINCESNAPLKRYLKTIILLVIDVNNAKAKAEKTIVI